MNEDRIIVPLHTPDFKFADIDKYLPRLIARELMRYSAIELPHKQFRLVMKDVRTRILKPVTGKVKNVPDVDVRAVRRKEAQAAAEPTVTERQLSAQEYFERALASQKIGALDAAIADYGEAIHLNPSDPGSHNNRGLARYEKGDLDGAIADFDKAILINSGYAGTYHNRGLARYSKGDLDGGMADFEVALRLDPQYADAYEAIRSKPRYAEVYMRRGLERMHKGDLDDAVADFEAAIRLGKNEPIESDAYGARGIVRGMQNDYRGAIADLEQALRLRSPDDPQVQSLRDSIAYWQKLL